MANPEIKRSYDVHPLNGENYFDWKYEMEHFLKGIKCWSILTEAKPVATETSAKEAEIKEWEENDQKAHAKIVLNTSRPLHSITRSAKTAAEAWKALGDHFQGRTLENRITIIRRICKKRMADGGNVETHINDMNDLFQQLVEHGETVMEAWRVAMLLSSLPTSYDALITALESRDKADLTMIFVKAKLIAEYHRRIENSGETKESILKTTTSHLECYFCKSKGHLKRDCRKYAQWKKNNPEKGSKHKANTVKQNGGEFLFTTSTSDINTWVVDSAATSHVSGNKGFFVELGAAGSSLTVANGERVHVEGKGACKIEFVNSDGQINAATLTDVLYVPGIKGNLISVKKLAAKGFKVIFYDEMCEIIKGNVQIAIADEINDLYVLRQPNKVNAVVQRLEHKANCIHNLHRIFGHRDPEAIREMCSKQMVDGIEIVDCGIKEKCEVCLKAKQTRSPIPKQSISKSKNVLDLVHTDVCGPMQTESPSGRRYLLTMIDDFSKYTVVYLLKEKSEVFEKLQQYVAMVHNKFGRKPVILRSDRGGEYTGAAVKKFLQDNGIQMQYTAPYSSFQNGVAERKNRTLIEMARCMLVDANLPNMFWAEAVNTSNYLQNRLPSRTIETTPFKLWNNKKPGMKHCVTFGSKCFVHIPSEKRRKLDNTAAQMVFVGYDENSKAYRCFDPVKQKVVISRDVRFVDGKGEIIPATVSVEIREDESNEDVERPEDESTPAIEENAAIDENEEGSEDNLAVGGQQQQRCVSQRSNKGVPPKRLIEEIHMVEQDIIEPKMLSQALKSKECEQWKLAMEEEMKSLHKNGTWQLCELPDGREAVGCKWVFKLKTDADGRVTRFKARLVAQGFSQKFGTDYDQVFAPVGKQTTFRVLLALASRNNYIVRHIDAKTAFLNGNLKETIYMKQPPGFERGENKVCWLKKSLYGLKQAARSWNEAIHAVLVDASFEYSTADRCLYRRNINGEWCFLLLYVDDGIVLGKTMEAINEVIQILSSKFDIEDLGDIRKCLGIEVGRTVDGFYCLSQSRYILKITSDFGLKDAKDSKVPMGVGYGKVVSKDNLLIDNKNYQSLIGCLLFVSVNTRPDISASVSILAQKMSAPTQDDWNELKRVVKYLKSTASLKLVLGNSKHDGELLYGYADASWAEDKSDRKSNSGYVFIVNGATVSWACRKQKCVALSSTESEFVALSEACQEVFWLRHLLEDMQQPIASAVVIHEDNQSCLSLIEEEKLSNRTKHIDTRRNFVKDYIEKGIIRCTYCPTDEMLADIMTKPLPTSKHVKFVEQLQLLN